MPTVLHTALESVVGPIAMDVDKALLGGDGFSDEQYEVVARMLLDSPYHAVDWKTLAGAVGATEAEEKGAIKRGMLVLQAMVQANALAYRPMSELSRDIPEEVFIKGKPVATAMTPAHLHAMREARASGFL